MPNWLKVGGSILAAAAMIAAFVGAIWWDARDRAMQEHDFRADLVAVGFANPTVNWDDETTQKNGTTTTESVLEAAVEVNGCDLELERKRGERNTVIINGREIEFYELDEGLVGTRGEFDFSDEIVDSMPKPTLEELAQLTRDHSDLNACRSE